MSASALLCGKVCYNWSAVAAPEAEAEFLHPQIPLRSY